ncbi:MAG: hypothetical protein JW934_04440 [Anaerolineae bacterium]|nr:hypothetical protein [Anaerolineae bacterium]
MLSERCFTAYGLRFGLQVQDPAIFDQATLHLPLGWQPAPPGEVDILYSLRTFSDQDKGAEYQFYCDTRLLARTVALDQLLLAFANHAQLLTAFRAQDCLFIHAGVVGWHGPAGWKAILIPGRSMTGKTTLVKALIRAGATYYSDEFAVLDKQGRVHPYPVPLSIREQIGRPGTKTPVEALGGQAGDDPLPVGLVVVAHYQPRARWRPQTLSPAQAVLALMDNTVAARRDPAHSMLILKQVVMSAKTIQGKRGEAKRIIPALLRELETRQVLQT